VLRGNKKNELKGGIPNLATEGTKKYNKEHREQVQMAIH
jgi:hypothetical protein